jgi:hypothetical protein
MEDVPADVKALLGPNEQVQMYIQQKFYGPKINIDSVVVTNERLILRHPHALRLKKDYTDYNYMDVSNVVLDKGVLRSTIRWFLRFGGEPLALNDLPNRDAEKLYGILRENLVRYQAPFTTGGAGIPPLRQAAPAAAAPGSRFCQKCGSALAAGQKFCGNCGAPA